MDLFGNQIAYHTRLIDTGVSIDQIAQIIVPGNIDNDKLGDILQHLGISVNGLDTSNQAKQYKLLTALNWEGCTVENVIHLHKANKQQAAASLIMAFLTSVRRATMASTPNSAPGTSTALDMLAVNLQALTNHIRDLPSQMAAMSLSSQSFAQNYAKSPTTPIPGYDPLNSAVSLARFVDTRYLRWIDENKLSPRDTFLYLHRIFPKGMSQDRAYEIIRARHPEDSLPKVISKLSEYFQVSTDSELFDLLQVFLTSKINPVSAEEDFQKLFELQASIQCQDKAYDEKRCLSLTKTQFCRALRPHSTMLSQALKVMTTSAAWTGTSSLHS